MEAEKQRLPFFPVSFFAMVMGLGGLTIAWKKAEQDLGISIALSPYLTILTAGVFLFFLVVYALKLLRYPEAARKELQHPVKLSFVPTISISMVLLSIVLAQGYPSIAKVLWATGSGLHLVLTLFIVGRWINHEGFEINHITPSWFIPAVGNILVPIVGVRFGGAEISWFFFSIGIVYWLVLMTMVYYRMFFHHPLPDQMTPTMFILIAPPAVGFISYSHLVGGLDAFGHVLYYTALFLTLLLISQIGKFARLKFFLSWWAYSFPTAAMTVATLFMREHTGLEVFHWLSWVFLLLTSALILGLFLRTLRAVQHHGICVSEH